MNPKTLKGIKLLSNPKVVSILKQIKESQPISVSHIYQKLRYEQSVTSTFLGKLREYNHVRTVREGERIYYSLNEEQIKEDFEGYVKDLG